MKNLKLGAVLLVLALMFGCKNATNNEAPAKPAESPCLEGQGDVDKTGISLDNGVTELTKTTEIVIIPQGKLGKIHMTDDTAWSTYYSGEKPWFKGVFINGRNVQLSPFAMGAYEVTQELYGAVMESNPSFFQGEEKLPATGENQNFRPAEQVTWYDAIAFCNELTKKTLGEENCVYYRNYDKTIVYTKTDATNMKTAIIDMTKKGYRLPTEAEWEFAARGGDSTNAEWKYAYAGISTEKEPASFEEYPYAEANLDNYGWYNDNSSSKTHEVGLKKANRLGLYDMSGNVSEWCWDMCNEEDPTSSDAIYTQDGIVVNPLGDADSTRRSFRSGSWYDHSYSCAVSLRGGVSQEYKNKQYGVRLARSL